MNPSSILDALANLCFALSSESDDANQLAGEMLSAAADLVDSSYLWRRHKSGRRMDPLLAAIEKTNEQIQPSR
jgi:hypothetical protein